ncbi:MAG: hypothetical protein QW057_05290 [Candidatus Bathyarchaeia archaeon]
MVFPLGLQELTLWLAVTAIILLATAELISPQYGEVGLAVDRKRLRNAAVITGLAFLATVTLRVYEVIAT